jgi:nucleosome assembly protein 1-like 1
MQNTPLGIYGFWMRAMLNHPNIAKQIQEKDRPILMHLVDITYMLHEVGFGFDLVFKFEKNDYFTNEELKKTFVMTKQNVIEKCEGTDIAWKDGKDITKAKKSKKKKGKKAVVKIIDCESFFNFFKTITLDSETV